MASPDHDLVTDPVHIENDLPVKVELEQLTRKCPDHPARSPPGLRLIFESARLMRELAR